jgi:membrane-bound inhibitor of C-type lysozyme
MNLQRKIFSYATVALMLAGCAGSEKLPTMKDYTEVSYLCERGSSVLVRFYEDQGLAVLVRNDEEFELQQESAASGFFYTNMKVSIRGKGEEISIEIGRMAAIPCHAE